MSAVKVVDRGAKELVERIRALGASKATVRVGVLSDAAKETRADEAEESVRGADAKKKRTQEKAQARVAASGKRHYSLLEVAAVHEFGAPAAGIPARSFIRATVDEHQADIERLQRVLLTQIVEGKIALKPALDAMGAKVAGWCQQRIAAGIAPPLAPETVKRKKSSVPLIDTGQLRSSITWVVEGA